MQFRLPSTLLVSALFLAARAHGTAPIGSAAGSASATENSIAVPFNFVREAIVVQVTVDSRGPYAMLLDTGVDPSVIDLKVARSIGLKVSGEGFQGSGGGAEANPAYETSLARVELGQLSAGNVDAVAMDLSQTSRALGMPIAGVLGYSLLKGRIVQIDYPQRTVRFLREAPSSASGANSGSTTVAFRYANEILIDDVYVNGKKVTANLDTGSNATFQLTPAAVAALDLSGAIAHAEPTRSTGFNGAAEHRRGTVDEIRIGTVSARAPAVVFYGKGTGHDEELWALRVGNGFLKSYRVTVDYQNSRVTLEQP